MLRHLLILVVLFCAAGIAWAQGSASFRPNILLVNVDDAGLEIGAYGDSQTHTHTIDRLSAAGVRFTNAFVTSPICSPSRTALMTGMYPTTLGAHHHRSQRVGPHQFAEAGTALAASYALPASVPFLPRLFKDAGYFVTLGGWGGRDGLAKSDYNVVWDHSVYDGDDWRARTPGQPFFAQLQLKGGKLRGGGRETAEALLRRVGHAVDPDDVVLPPAYPDTPETRLDWAAYLSTWEETDDSVRAALDALDASGVLDSTVVVFMTDHGISHLRGKQFLTDEGTHIPLIIRFPLSLAPPSGSPGTVRSDLVSHIDIAATVLAVAGIDLPRAVQGRDLFARELAPRPYVFAARDRADETIDLIRSVRTERYKYVRNGYADRPHLQVNLYKEGKDVVRAARRAHAAGLTTPLQDRLLFAPTRAPEELYDLTADPFETVNLVTDPRYRSTLDTLRSTLHTWMSRTGDLGVIPEPVLEALGAESESKAEIWLRLDLPSLQSRAWGAIESSERGGGAV